MATRQVTYPNLGVPATRGWCLKYVDDGVNAPSRTPTAKASWETNPDKRGGEPPVGVWVPIFFSLSVGDLAALGHIAWAFNHGGGWIEIYDSETRAGARSVYRNIDELLRWFGKFGPTYLGWSLSVDGARVAEEVADPAPAPSNGVERKAATGTATVLVDVLNIRNAPDRNSELAGQYTKGQTFNYDSWCKANGYVWLSYVSYSGVRRFVADGPDDGREDTVYVSGGV